MTIPMTSERVAPRDPQEKRPGFYVMLDKPVGGLPSNDGRGHHPIYINGDRLVTFAKMVGGIQDDSILELLRTAKGFRQLVHHIGVSATADSAMPVRMTLGFEGERGSAGSRHGVDLVANGQEAILDVAGLDWADTDAIPGELLFDMPTPKDIVSATVKLYLNDGYTVPEVDPDPPVAFDSPAYAAMIARSALSTGNNARVKRVLADLRAGKPVTIAFIGGSITQGAGAVPTQEMCYARRTFEGICEKYAADPSKVRYIKAGVGGTPSQLGLVRYDRDITRDGAVHPDLVVVEFAVNDEGDETKGLCYESLIKRIWDEPGQPAVLMLFSVFADDWNLKARLAPIGFRHEIPMVDVLEAVSPQFVPAAGERPVITRRQYFYDVFHPSNNGHRVMADSLLYMIERLDRQQLMEEPKPAPAYYGFDFAALHSFDRSALPGGVTVDPGSFTGTDTDLQSVPLDAEDVNTPQFPCNWQKAEGDAPFVLELTCRGLQLVLKDSGSPDFGPALVTVDGGEPLRYDPRDAGWTHCHATVLLDEPEARPHRIEIRMAPDAADKTFTILGFGWVK